MKNILEGRPLRYLIGAESAGSGRDGEITVVPYGEPPVRHGISVGYCNSFDEHNTGDYAPYLKSSDTAKEYNERVIDPRGPGWNKNLSEQFARRKKLGFKYIELDNPDAYDIADVVGAIDLAARYRLKVIAKNPELVQDEGERYLRHSNVVGAIVEKDAGDPSSMDEVRRSAGKPDLPVWFVAFGDGLAWAKNVARAAKSYRNMWITYSDHGEYESSRDVNV